jgi:glycosyltransferase involved in cell wall biosynthesis
MVMPENERLARAGELLESRIAPPFYRRSPIVTLSESSKAELVHDLGFRDDHVTVVSPGIHPRFTPGGRRDDEPLVCAVGRLVPVKRYDRLIETMARVRHLHPTTKLVIVGEGYERPVLEAVIRRLDAADWVSLPGRLGDDEVIDLYRRAWLVASASAREGWGMTATEAAACGTTSVMTDIAGHRDAIADGETGLLARDLDDLAVQITRVIGDEVLRKTLAEAALERAKGLTWDATASGAFAVLAAEAARRNHSR